VNANREIVGRCALAITLVVFVGGPILMNWDKLFPNGRIVRAEMDLRAFAQGLELYRREHDGRLPDTLDSLWNAVGRGCLGAVGGGGIVPLDPWDHEYSYLALADGTFDLVCFGADGKPGGEGEDADLTSWK